MRRTLILLLPLALAACGATTGTTPDANTNPSGASAISRTPTAPPKMETVKMTDEGFSPKDITVPAGTAVVFHNTGTKAHRPASDPHPEHTDYYGFDSLVGVSAGSTYTFTFTKVGTWKFHDELDLKNTGTITVVAAGDASSAPAAVSDAPVLETPASPAPTPVSEAPSSAS